MAKVKKGNLSKKSSSKKSDSIFSTRQRVIAVLFLFVGWFVINGYPGFVEKINRNDPNRFYGGDHNRKYINPKNGIDVWKFQDFLSGERAQMAYEGLEMFWHAKNDSWLYTTNDSGSNKKVRSNDQMEERRELALSFFNAGRFSYSKYELVQETDLYQHLMEYISSTKIMEKITFLMSNSKSEKYPDFVQDKFVSVSDMFISCYTDEDFLSIHDDNALGSYAFILSLTPNWKPEYGGILEFTNQYHADSGSYFDIVPEFNTLTIFKTRPERVFHRVTQLHTSKRRYAITGWFTTASDIFNDRDKETQRQVKAQK